MTERKIIWDGSDAAHEAVLEMCGDSFRTIDGDECIEVDRLDGWAILAPGDVIIRCEEGDYWVDRLEDPLGTP